MTWICAQKINVRLDGIPVLKNVDLQVEKGEMLGLVGPNGAGKTTLLKVLARLLKPDAGSVDIAGGIKGQAFSQTVAYLPQGHEVHWLLSVERLVSLGRIPYLMPWQRLRSHDKKAVEQAMIDTGIFHLAERSIDHLAGGERSLVLLARALATQPSIILADEPVQGLDPAHGLQVMELLRGFALSGRGVVVVLHDLTLAARFCHRIVLLNEGQVMASGHPEKVLKAENLRRSYHIEAKYGSHEDFYVIPWKRL